MELSAECRHSRLYSVPMLKWMRILIAVASASVVWAAPNLAHVPLTFEPGARSSEFIAHTGGLNVAVTPMGAMVEHGSMRLIGANSHGAAIPEDLLPSYSNYLIDPDPQRWRTHVPNYRRVRYRNVYPGIDVVYYGNPRELEFDFLLAPGADVRKIRLALSSRDLSIRLPGIYQNNRTIGGRAIRRGKYVTFALPAYDHSQPLVIDPVLSYTAVFGGGGFDGGRAIAVDSTGATYVTGNAGSGNFPVVNGLPAQSSSFLSKLSPSGDALVYSTYLSFPIGGGPGNVAVDAAGNLYFAGPYFTPPNVSGPPVVGPSPIGQCIADVPAVLYVAKLRFDGSSFVYSGCIAGSMFPAGPNVIAADGGGNAYVAGLTQSSNFPLVNPLPSPPLTNPGPPRAFVLKLGPNGALLYSSFVGGSSSDTISAIAADPAGNIYLAGRTFSPDFPIKNAIQPRPPSSFPAFVTKIKADGSDYVYSTYFGGSNDDPILAIAADAAGKTYLAGSTISGNLPVTANAFQNRFDGTFLFKTTDAGKTWNRSDLGLPATALSVQVDPQQSSTVYAVSAGGLFKSIDRGASWRATSAAAVNSLWIDPADSTLFVGTTHGDLVRSRDRGATFTGLSAAPGGNLNEMAFDPTNGSVIYARWGGHGSTDGIYKSTDGGDTWKPTGLVGAMTGSGPFAVDPTHPSNLFAEARNGGLLKSLDGGATWTPLGGEVTQIVVDSKSTLYTVVGATVQVLPLGGTTIVKVAPGSVGPLLIDPTNSSTWYATIYSASGPSIYKTTDAGDTWQIFDSGLPSSITIPSMALDPSSPQTLYVGAVPNSDGFFAKLSADGASLQYSTYLGGSGTDASTAIGVDAAGNSFLAGTTDSTDFPLQAAFRQTGIGFAVEFDATDKLVWSSLLGGASPTAIALGSKSELYLTGSATSPTFSATGALGPLISGNLFRTANSGTTWTASTLPTSVTGAGVTAVAVDPKNSSHAYALADRLYASNDAGQTWSQLGAPTPSPYIPVPINGSPVKLILDPTNVSTMYVPGGFCLVNTVSYLGCGVAKSTDGGVTWTENQIAPAPVNQPPISVADLAVDPKTPSILYAATTSGIYKSTDAGVTWNFTGSFSNAVAVAVDPLKSSIVYASFGTTITTSATTGPVVNSSPGLFKSVDAGATWGPLNGGLPPGWFANELVVDPSVPDRIYAVGAPASPGLYRTDDGGTWSSIGSGLPNSWINTLALDPGNSSTLYAGPFAGGLYRSRDAGVSWSKMAGLSVPIVYGIAVAPTDSSRIYAGTQLNPADAFVMKIAQ